MVDIFLTCGNPEAHEKKESEVPMNIVDAGWGGEEYYEVWQCPECGNTVFLYIKRGEPKP